jgi:hypothetical protein
VKEEANLFASFDEPLKPAASVSQVTMMADDAMMQ